MFHSGLVAVVSHHFQSIISIFILITTLVTARTFQPVLVFLLFSEET